MDEAGAGAAAARRLSAARFAVVAAGTVAGGATGVWVSTATATLADPGDPRLGWRFAWFLIGIAWGLVVHLVAGSLPRFPASARPVAGALDLGPTERAAFSTTLRSTWLTAGLLATTAVLAVTAATTVPGLWAAAAVTGVLTLFSGRFRVTADRRGLRLVAGLPGVTLRRIALADIARAETTDLDPVMWGGWGYRVMPGRTALVLRGGPALVLHLRDGRRFAVTLDRPEVPAALLNGLQARARS